MTDTTAVATSSRKGRGLNWAKKDITGQRFGKLVVISELPGRGSSGAIYWACVCDCGTIRNILGRSLRTGRSNSCPSCATKKHDLSFHPLYRVWGGIKKRCFDKGDCGYKNYGGRGIIMCDEWKNSFIAFYNDMIDGYKKGIQIDRINNNGNYCKENCRWVTAKENRNNTRDSIFLTVFGRTQSIIYWAKEMKINPSTVYARKHRGWTDADCIKK